MSHIQTQKTVFQHICMSHLLSSRGRETPESLVQIMKQ